MRTALTLWLLFPAIAFAQLPKDKYTISKERMEADLNHDRIQGIKKLERELPPLQAAIAQASKLPVRSRRGQNVEVRNYYGEQVSGFTLPLTKVDVTRAKAKVKDLQAEITKLKATKVKPPEVEFSSIVENMNEGAFNACCVGICYLVEVPSSATGDKALPVCGQVMKIGNGIITLQHHSGIEISIFIDGSKHYVGELISLDMPVNVRGTVSGGPGRGITIEIFENP